MNPMAIIAAIVINEKRTLWKVFAYWRSMAIGPKPMTNPEMMAATRIPVPLAESQFKLNTAPSGVGFATTGGTRNIKLCRPATGILKMERLSKNVLTAGSPQRNTITVRMAHGVQALATSAEL